MQVDDAAAFVWFGLCRLDMLNGHFSVSGRNRTCSIVSCDDTKMMPEWYRSLDLLHNICAEDGWKSELEVFREPIMEAMGMVFEVHHGNAELRSAIWSLPD